MAAGSKHLINIPEWIKTYEPSFTPPVCNKLMHGAGQLKIMFIGGPNLRKDYHIEEGEELFYQLRGDMVLKIVEKGQHKDVVIKEGEVFRLPSRVPHSPQRQANTVGLVIERERYESERDGLRYYQEGTTDPLWEKWFHCFDLGVQLGPVIAEYFASEEHKAGKPPEGKVFEEPPFKIDTTTEVTAPVPLSTHLDALRASADSSRPVFEQGEFRVVAVMNKGDGYVAGETKAGQEAFIWVLEGEGKVQVSAEEHILNTQDSLLVTESCKYRVEGISEDFIALVISMDPLANK